MAAEEYPWGHWRARYDHREGVHVHRHRRSNTYSMDHFTCEQVDKELLDAGMGVAISVQLSCLTLS